MANSPRLLLAVAAATALGCAGDGPGDDASSPTRAATATASATVSRTLVPSATASPTFTPTPTGTRTPTPSPAFTPTATVTATSSHTSTATSTSTATPTVTATETPLRTPVSCDAFVGATIGGARVTSAAVVAAAGDTPEFCRVGARIEPALNFEVRLPEGWNEKILFLGGAGYDGSIPVPDGIGPAGGPLARGYVTVATDSGHAGSPFDASWALNDSEAVENFADLARHRVLAAAREIVLTRYALPIRRTYFEGGSSGGREGLIEAQRWPDNYDGIIARAPAASFTALNLAGNRIARQIFANADGYLSPAAVQVLSRGVLAACDDLDGLADEIVSNVEACQFDPATLLCAGAQEDCLTAEHIDTVRTVFSPLQLDFSLAHGVTSHPAFPLSGAEDAPGGWLLWLTGFSPKPSSLLFTLQDQFFKYFVVQDQLFDSLALAPAKLSDRLMSLSTLLDATDPDLAAFKSRGGKLILWHGLADYAISAYGTAEYYRRVVTSAGGQEDADAFVRFYTAPGVDHTGGGKGAPSADLLGALDAWVEEGTAPEDLIAYRLEGADFTPFRPLCRYPTYPRYDGTGDPASASSFSCAQSR